MKNMLTRAKDKLINRHGTSLGEMLVCVLIMLLASGLLVSGVSLASNLFERTFSKSQAQVIKSTLSAAVSEELRYTTHVWVEKTGSKYSFDGYFSNRYGGDEDGESRFTIADDKGRTISSDSYGYICAAGNNMVSSKVYSHGYRANITIVPTVSGTGTGVLKIDYFTVTISIQKNGDSSTRESTTFMVIPINEPQVDVK